MIDPPDADAPEELDPPDEAEIEEIVRRLVGGSDDALHPMHHPLLPPTPELIPAADAGASLDFKLSSSTRTTLHVVAYWQTRMFLKADRPVGRRVRVEESTGLVAAVDGVPGPDRRTRLAAFERAIAAAGGVVSARHAESDDAPPGADVAPAVGYLIGLLRPNDVRDLLERCVGPVGRPLEGAGGDDGAPDGA